MAKSALLICYCLFFEINESEKNNINKLVPFANSFVIYLFQLINCLFQIEQRTAISKLKSTKEISEYYIVVLSLKTMKTFKGLFINLINKENIFEVEFREMGLKIGRIKKYAQEVDKEVDEKMGEGGGVMARLKRIIERGVTSSSGREGLSADEEITEVLLDNRGQLTTPISFWSPLLDRLNFVCIGIHCVLFKHPIDPEKDKKMNVLWRTFFENVKLINLQVKEQRLDPKKVSLSQEKNLKMHKEFFLFWFKELIPKMGTQTDLDALLQFLQENFKKIYGEGDVFWLLKLSKQSKAVSQQKEGAKLAQSMKINSVRPKNSSMSNSFEFPQQIEEKKRISLRRVEEEEKRPKKTSPVRYSMMLSGSVLNKFQTPVKADLKMVKEESMTTDSEMEEFRKTVTTFKSKKPEEKKGKFIGEGLERRNETFDQSPK